MTLEQRVAALESGELARLRMVAQRRLEKLRVERAAVADLRQRLELAHAKADAFSRRLASIAEDHADELALLRVTVQAAPDATASEVVADAIDHVKQLRELIDDERSESEKEITALRGELAIAKAKLAATNDSLERLRDYVVGTNLDDTADAVIEKAITELTATRAKLRDAHAELAEARAELAGIHAKADGILGRFQ